MRVRAGFTLIELLVVIAVIAVLAAIIFPMYCATQNRARQTRCMNNLRQLGSALQRYIADNGGRVPPISPYEFSLPTPNWCGTQAIFGKTIIDQGSLWPYTLNRDIYLCPLDRGREAAGLKKISDVSYRKAYPLSYSMNGELCKRVSGPGNKWECLLMDTDIRRPCQVLLLIHEKRSSINDGLFLWRNNGDQPGDIHDDGTMLSYCDGHVRWMSFNALIKLQESRNCPWDPYPNR